MAGAKEIRTKIKSIQNTQKITKAMEMVAASKMRRAQDRMQAARPYADRIANVIAHLAHAHPEYKHPFVLEREAKTVGFIIVSTDRGLCGGLNVNLFRGTLNTMEHWQKQGAKLKFAIIGNKGLGFFKRIGAEIASEASHLGDTPALTDLVGAVKVMLDDYQEGTLDRVFLLHNEFINSMTQRPTTVQ